ncbi:MAG TPA: PepSY-associated TM helix domain-containing protein [Gemmatimonadaceae bacterium]|nr:PepSY-associated TM helix domain-containing protein [Gemmatimonadaceae bacterium]
MRSVVIVAHRWLGLVAGLLLVVIGLSGSALVFRQEIDEALNPELLRVTPAATRVPMQQVLDVAQRAFPDEAPSRIRMPRTPEGVVEVWLGRAPSRYVYVDPYRGTLLGARRPTEFLTGWLFYLHTKLLSGDAGERVVGVGALVLAVLSITGLVLWRPRRRSKREAQREARVAIASGGRRRSAYDLHRAVGFYSSALLLIASLTGASLVFHEAFEGIIYGLTRTPSKPAIPLAVSPPDRPSLPLDSLLSIAERAQPGGKISYIYPADAPTAAFRVRKRLAPEIHPNGRSYVALDPRTGAVLGVEDGGRAPLGAQVYNALYPLHIGIGGSTAMRVLVLVVGLAPALLAVTGVLQWWRRSARRRRRGRGRSPARFSRAA